jgi:hypothetical protein
MFAEKAASLDSTNSAYMVEVGYQYLLRGRTKVKKRKEIDSVKTLFR